jgi:membrane-associated protease RseP (regulator of RpoE activity)
VESTRERGISIALFFATLGSMFWSQGGPEAMRDLDMALRAAAYTGALMSILLTHELAHYLVALRHGFRLSLPYFIPLPWGFGTLGAVISLRSRPTSRTALLEMGVAGPLAGAVVAFVMLAIGLRWTGPDIPLEPGFSYLIFADPWVVELLGGLVLGAPPGRYAELHPVALAGWIGCLLTSLNLLPIGQADGGHVVSALLPRWARWVTWGVIGAMLVASFVVWPGWAVWAGVLLIIGAWRNLEVPSRPALTTRAKVLATLGLVAFVLTFMPEPIELEQVEALVPDEEAAAPLGE